LTKKKKLSSPGKAVERPEEVEGDLLRIRRDALLPEEDFLMGTA